MAIDTIIIINILLEFYIFVSVPMNYLQDIKIFNLHYCLQRHDNPDFRASHKSKCTSPLQILSLFYSAFDRTENCSGS